MTSTSIEPLSIGQFLKTQTCELHRLVEARLSKILFHRDLHKAAYLDILIRMRVAYQDMERAIQGFSTLTDAFAGRSKLDWLEDDIGYLRTLCLDSSGALQARVQVEHGCLTALQCASQAMGMLYVMEGATLGGAQIQARLCRHQWLSAQHGLAFFNSYGDERLTKWNEFLARLQEHCGDEQASYSQVEWGAQYAFEKIYQALEGVHL